MYIFEGSPFRGSCPSPASSFHLLGNTAPDLGSWWADVAIPVCCSRSLPRSRLSPSLPCDTHQLLSQLCLARNFRASLQTRLCRLQFHQREKRTAVSDIQKLVLPSLGAFQSLPHAWFVEWLRFPPQMVTLMTGCAAVSPHKAYLALGEKGLWNPWKPASALCIVSCIVLVSYSKISP